MEPLLIEKELIYNLSFVEDKTFLNGGVAIVKYLGKERIQSLECAHIMLEQDKHVHFVLSIFGCFAIFLGIGIGSFQLFLSRFITMQNPCDDWL